MAFPVLMRLFCPFAAEGVEHNGEAVIHVKRRLIFYLRVDDASVNGGRNLIRFPVQPGKCISHCVPVKVDGHNLSDVAFVGHLIAVVVESVAVSGIGQHLFPRTDVGHPLQNRGHILTGGIQAGLGVQVNLLLCFAWWIAFASFSFSLSSHTRNSTIVVMRSA